MSQSVLDKMTAGIMGMKEAKAATLTPVGMEGEPSAQRRGIADMVGDVFPHDGGMGGQLVHSARVIRHELAQIEAGLRSIEREAGLTEGGPPPISTVTKEDAAHAEQLRQDAEIDEQVRFRDDFAAKAKAAQAATFTDLDEPAGPVPVTEHSGDGWGCPTHGTSEFRTLTSRKGRTYRACGKCDEFERPTQ